MIEDLIREKERLDKDGVRVREEFALRNERVLVDVLVDFAVEKQLGSNQEILGRERRYLALLERLEWKSLIYEYRCLDEFGGDVSVNYIDWNAVFKRFALIHWKDVKKMEVD